MAARFTYSKWDGTQKGFDLDAESILQELTDELLYHGDLNSALRQLMRDGMTDKDGNRIEGLRDLMERIKQRREEIEDSGDLGGVYSEIADALKDILDEERHTIENDLRQAENSGDQRRAENARNSAMERNFRLDMMPDDLAGMVREMQHYDFQSQDAQRRFDELMDKLREQLMQQFVDQNRCASADVDDRLRVLNAGGADHLQGRPGARLKPANRLRRLRLIDVFPMRLPRAHSGASMTMPS